MKVTLFALVALFGAAYAAPVAQKSDAVEKREQLQNLFYVPAGAEGDAVEKREQLQNLFYVPAGAEGDAAAK
ncbi:hypothetical protein B7463_g8833, partial [Scytalidium lignicola]